MKRPILKVTLIHGDHWHTCEAIVDSGADFCVFPRHFMEKLRLDPRALAADSSKGVGNSDVLSYFSKVGLYIPRIGAIQVDAGFSEGMEHMGLGLLGQQGFFEAFRVTFDLPQNFFYLETP